MSYKRQRITLIFSGMLCITAAAAIILTSLKDNLVFFYSPTDIKTKGVEVGRHIRVGGLVKEGSILEFDDKLRLEFTLTDLAEDLHIQYTGIKPNMFREGQGMVAEGALSEGGAFKAKRLLTKHDEKYMPPEVVDSLKKSGKWKPKEGMQ